LQYVASSPADTSVNKSYTVKIAGEVVGSGTYNIDGKKGTYEIASGSKTINKATSAKSIAFSVGFDFYMTWSGNYAGTQSASGSISIAAITSYKVSYNANGGTGAPSAQTKYHNSSLTLSSTKPTRAGHVFQGWGTTASATTAKYQPGASYNANATVTLYAIWKANTYTVSYNANGGTGAPGNQTKTYGVALTLSSTIPTKNRYSFQGWGTSSSATTATYKAGGSYTKNSAATLYAVWRLAYIAPRIVNLSISRCDSNGAESDEGTNALISFDWACDNEVSSITIKWKLPSDATWAGSNVSATGTSGNVSHVVGSDSLSTELSYDIQVVVSDGNGSSYVTGTVTSMRFAIDALAGGNGVAFGKTAELEDTAEFEFDAKFNGRVYGNVLGLNKLPEIPVGSDFNDYIDTGCWAVYKNANAQQIAHMPIETAGRLEVASTTGEGIRAEQYSYIRQRFIPYQLSNAIWERDITRGSNNAWTYGEWTRTSLTPDAAKKAYHQQIALWTGEWYMSAGQTANLKQAVSEQPNGIVLVFSKYSDGAAVNNNFNHFFVPKRFVENNPGVGSGFTMMDTNFGQICHKYLYINDTSIAGHDGNKATGTGASGIKYDNAKYVLRMVIGV
jgi:uncharacterized repeat protein (TIGR02543 family)